MTRNQNFAILLSVIISLFVLGFVAQTSFAVEVTIIAEPPETTIQLGGEAVALTVEAEGTDLKFSWRLVGVGTLEDQSDGEAMLYVPQKQIEEDSDRAIVSVKVENYRGEETTKSVTFKICKNCDLVSAQTSETPTPMPTSLTNDNFPIPDDVGTSQFIFKKLTAEQPYLIVSQGSGRFPEISGGNRRATEREKEQGILIFNGKILTVPGLKVTNWNEDIVQLVNETFPQAQCVAPNESVRPGTDVVSIDGIDYWGNATVVRANFPEKLLEVVSGDFHKP